MIRLSSTGHGYELLALADADAISVGERGPDWVPLRRRLGIGAFGVNAFRAASSGDFLIEDHVESPGQEELYVVLQGSARMSVGDEQVDLDAGTAVFVADPQLRRSAIAREDETIVLAVGGWVGRAYHPLPWEPIYLARPAMQRGDWKQAASVLLDEGGEQLERPILQYRLACCHARLGEGALAIAELTRAIAGDPVYRDRATAEEAFAPLRGRDDWPG